MSEPETITLRKLPPEHVLRRCDVYFDSMGSVNAGSSIGKHVLETDHVWWCRAEDYPAEYDKPAIDPGEGWRIYDQHKEGREPKKVIEFLDRDGKWKQRPFPCDELIKTAVYRVPVTTQPDRLTELRQQGERQAKRIEGLEHSLSQYKQAFQNALSCVDKVFQKDAGCDPLLPDFVSLGGDKFEAVITLAEDYKRQAAEIADLKSQLQKNDDKWMHMRSRDSCLLYEEKESRDKRIRELEEQVKQLEATSHPLRWERRKPTEEECRERWIIERDETGTVYGWEPGEQPADEYHTMICVLPPIADAEPERRMITQRRWLVNGPEGWQEAWPKDGEAPGSEWLELIKTSMTREVPE